MSQEQAQETKKHLLPLLGGFPKHQASSHNLYTENQALLGQQNGKTCTKEPVLEGVGHRIEIDGVKQVGTTGVGCCGEGGQARAGQSSLALGGDLRKTGAYTLLVPSTGMADRGNRVLRPEVGCFH